MRDYFKLYDVILKFVFSLKTTTYCLGGKKRIVWEFRSEFWDFQDSNLISEAPYTHSKYVREEKAFLNNSYVRFNCLLFSILLALAVC